MDKNKSYTPVSCAQHSQFELLIMHHETVELHWQDDKGAIQVRIVTPSDLQTQAGEEFLVAKDTRGEQYRIRLDHIQHYQTI